MKRLLLIAVAITGALLAAPHANAHQINPIFVGGAAAPTATPFFKHVVIIEQENRTTDNLFQGYCDSADSSCANTSNSFTRSDGTTGTLTAIPLAQSYDIGHTHQDYVAACNRSYLDLLGGAHGGGTTGDTVAVTINGHTVTYTVTTSNETLANTTFGVANAINNDATDGAIVHATTLNGSTDVAGDRIQITPLTVPNSYSLSMVIISATTLHGYAAPQISGACSMDGFDREQCSGPPCPADYPFTSVNASDLTHYTNMATQGTLLDENFSAQMAPSLVSHVYIAAANSGDSTEQISSNPGSGAPGCEHIGTAKAVLRPGSVFDYYPGVEIGAAYNPACVNVPTIYSILDTAGVSWTYYVNALNGSTSPVGLWDACALIQACCGAVVSSQCTGAEYAAHVSAPASQILTDISNEVLSSVTWVTTSLANSDHPGSTSGGPAYVAGIVNAIGTDNGGFYWTTQPTLVCLVWDDWGGFWDHVAPPASNNYSNPMNYGFRTPMVCYSAYTIRTVNHTVRDSTSILHLLETNFHLTGPIGPFSIEQVHDDLSNTYRTTSPTAFSGI